MLQLRLVSRYRPSSVSASKSSKIHVPGSRLTLVMRISGMRFQREARIQPLLFKPNVLAYLLAVTGQVHVQDVLPPGGALSAAERTRVRADLDLIAGYGRRRDAAARFDQFLLYIGAFAVGKGLAAPDGH